PGDAGAAGTAGKGGKGNPNGADGKAGAAGKQGEQGQPGAAGHMGAPGLHGGNAANTSTAAFGSQALTVRLQAPDVTADNADDQDPYTFTLTFNDSTLLSSDAIIDAKVLVQPPSGPAITAILTDLSLDGTTDKLGDAS